MHYIIGFIIFMLPVSFAYAGAMDFVKAIGSSSSLWIAVVSAIILVIFKKFPNEKIYKIVYKFFKKLGTASTLWLNTWKWSAPFWQKHIEPWFIDFLQNTVGAGLNGYIDGLRTDNKESENDG